MGRAGILVGALAITLAVSVDAPSTRADSSPPPAPPTMETPTTAAVPSTTSPADPAALAVADPGLIRLGDLLSEEDGRLPIDDALATFAALVAPLPGVVPLAAADELPPGAASLAIRRILSEPALPPAVVDAVERALAPAPGDVEAVIEPGDIDDTSTTAALTGRVPHLPSAARGRAAVPSPADLSAMVAEYAGYFTRMSGHELSIPIHARIVGAGRVGRDEGVTTPMGPMSDPTGCRLLLSRSMFESGGSAEHLTSTVLHEVWHCFQLDADPAAYSSGPEWIIEGQAEWAGEEPVGGSPASAERWDTWLLSPQRSLYRRSYDAIGVYAVAQASGVDPYTTMLPMLGQAGSAAVETLFGSDAAAAVLATASALVRAPERGPEWESFGPGITGAQGAPVLAVPDGAPATVQRTAGRFATLPVVLTVTAGDIARITVIGGSSGAVELPGTDVVRLAPGGTASFCLRPDGCLCPDGSAPGGGEPLPAASPGEGAVAIGAVDGGDLAVTAVKLTLEESCQTIVGTWATTFEAALQAGTAPYGGVPMACTGPYTITYSADGSFTGGSNATCTLDEMSSVMNLTFSGTYTADGTNIVVSSFAAQGTVTMNGITMEAPFPPPSSSSGSGTYTIVSDTLTLVTTTPDGNTVTLSLTRAA